MKNKVITGIIGALLILFLAQVYGQSKPDVDTPEARRKAVQIYLTLVPMRDFMRDAVEELAKQVQPSERQDFIALMTKHFRIDVLEKAAAESLAKHLTLKEIKVFIEFMERPEGKSAMAKMKYYMADTMPVVQQEIARALQLLQSERSKSGNPSK